MMVYCNHHGTYHKGRTQKIACILHLYTHNYNSLREAMVFALKCKHSLPQSYKVLNRRVDQFEMELCMRGIWSGVK